MPLLYQCKNHITCGQWIGSGKLCESCKQDARQLEREVRENEIAETPQYLSKNDGLRRRPHYNPRKGRAR